MKIKWKNIAAVALLLIGLILWARWLDHVGDALSHIAQIVPENEPADRMIGTIVLSLLCLTFVCTVRLLRNR